MARVIDNVAPPQRTVTFSTDYACSTETVVTVPPSSFRVKALTIGISYGGQLVTPEEDIKYAEAAIRRLFPQAEFVIMTESSGDSSMIPNNANMTRELKKFVLPEEENVYYILWYAGHTGQSDTIVDSGEKDGKDEYIVPCDARRPDGSYIQELVILDNLLRCWIVDPLKTRKGGRLWAVFDTCASGTIMDLVHQRCNRICHWTGLGRRPIRKVREEIEAIARRSTFESIESFRESALARMIKGLVPSAMGSVLPYEYVKATLGQIAKMTKYRHCSGFCCRRTAPDGPIIMCISACKDSEEVFDIVGENVNVSMSRAIYNTLCDNANLHYNPNPTLKELMRELHANSKNQLRLRKEKRKERKKKYPDEKLPRPALSQPQISSLHPLDMRRTLFPFTSDFKS